MNARHTCGTANHDTCSPMSRTVTLDLTVIPAWAEQIQTPGCWPDSSDLPPQSSQHINDLRKRSLTGTFKQLVVLGLAASRVTPHASARELRATVLREIVHASGRVSVVRGSCAMPRCKYDGQDQAAGEPHATCRTEEPEHATNAQALAIAVDRSADHEGQQT